MTSSVFPDVNVWLAMSLITHQHHEAARAWYDRLPSETDLVFSRLTQLGLLRLLTTVGAAGEETMTQRQAWAVYDTWINQGGAVYQEEPFGLEREFRSLSDRAEASPKDWGDSYLVAFAASTSMPLITFDRALGGRYARSVLLKG